MARFLNTCDALAKIAGALAIVILILTTAFPQIGALTKALASERFGTTGVLKYELGSPLLRKRGKLVTNTDGTPVVASIRQATGAGQLHLLRSGDREFDQLRYGDVLMAAGTNILRQNNGCSTRSPTDCTTASPELFKLRQGQCVIVLSRHNHDSGEDDSLYVNKIGGWIRVATTACGVFE